MATPHGLPSFRQRALSLSSLNVPRRFHLPIILLRLLSIIPAGIGLLQSITRIYQQPAYDDTGLFENKSTPINCCVAMLWIMLAGYWSWILTTSMMRRWLYHYEGSNAIVRLATLMLINWSVYAFISSYFGADQPVWQWMNACLILLVCNILKIALASNPKYTKRSINHRSTVVRVMVLPLSVVVVITTLVTLIQVRSLRSQSGAAMSLPSSSAAGKGGEGMAMMTMQKYPEMPETAAIKVMVFILSAWTPKSVTKRQAFRETTMKLMPGNTDEIAYFHRFIMGQPPNEKVRQNMWPTIEAEMAMHGDVLLLNCSDKYEDLSRKVFSTMEWADQYEFDYLVKTDDDIFVRWDTITAELLELGVQQRYWQGLSYWNIPPIRDNTNKNSEFGYPLPLFPRYTAGALYILSRDLVRLIARGPRVFVKNEDQNLGVWLFPYQVEPILDARIQQIDVCEEDMIAKHFGDFGDPEAIGGTMYDMLDNLRNGRKMCQGFRTKFCALCYPCQGKVNHWRDWNFDCDPVKGITLLNMPKLTLLE